MEAQGTIPQEQPEPVEEPVEEGGTMYVVLVWQEGLGWHEADTVRAQSERDAKNAVFEQREENELEMVAVPARSWKPERGRATKRVAWEKA